MSENNKLEMFTEGQLLSQILQAPSGQLIPNRFVIKESQPAVCGAECNGECHGG